MLLLKILMLTSDGAVAPMPGPPHPFSVVS